MFEKKLETILVVDDDLTFLEITSSYLENCGFKVERARNGREALNIFDTKIHDIILTDLYMPVMSGLQLIDIFKKLSPDTPIIVLSGQGDMKDAIATLRLGAWDYIIKPFPQNVLEQTVTRVIDKLRLIRENQKITLELQKTNLQLEHGLEQLKADQKAAESVQKMLLPKPITSFNGYSMSYKLIPSLYLSGDFVDYFQVDDERVVFYIADVSGHGASSAFITVLLKGFISRMLTQFHSGNDDTILFPDKVLESFSKELLKAKLGKYVTMVYCVLNTKENSLDYSIAGHYPSPIIIDGYKACFLKGGGYAVGIYKDATFTCNHCKLPPQFSMLMLSDGIFEIMTGGNLEASEHKLLSYVGGPSVTIDKIVQKFALNKERGFPDDIAMLLMSKKDSNFIEAKT